MILSLLIFGIPLSGQKDALKKANAAFDEDKYREALVYYNRIDGIDRSGPLLFKRGVCQFELNQVELATSDFRQAYQYGYRNPDIDLYTGRISHNKGKFAEAAEYYKIYLQQTTMESGDRESVRQLIKQCGRAVDLSYFKPIAIIERAPKGVNTVFDDLSMIPSPTQKGKYYFTSNRPNTSTTMDASDFDVYSITVNNGKWGETNRLPFAINKGKEDILVGFTQNAGGMILFRGEKFKGDIAINTGGGDNNKTTSVSLPGDFNYQTSDVFFYDDNLVIFSARLNDSYGGYDLYYTKLENDKWSKPKNLGPDINGPFDEISPYLSADGSELYYSSNRNESIGGHDIFFSSFLYEAERWSAPTNLGIPINSPGDDLNFELSFDGLTATISSNRKTAIGGLDVFLARFKKPRGQQTYSSNYLPFADYRIVVAEETVAVDTDKQTQETTTPEKEVIATSTETATKSTEANTPQPAVTTATKDVELVAATKDKIETTESAIVNTNTVSTSMTANSTPLIKDTTTIVTSNTKATSEDLTPPTSAIEVADEQPGPAPSNLIKQQQQRLNPYAGKTVEIPSEQLDWSPLFYNTGKDILEKKNLKQVDVIKIYLDKYQDVAVDIICHSNNEGILEFKLFSSIKLAERIKSYLLDQGIQSRRLSVKSYADNYPVAKTESLGGASGLADTYNARIEFNFYNSSGLPMPIERIDPDIPVHSYDSRNDIFEAVTGNAVVYKIQIATVSQMYRGMTLAQFNDAAVEIDPITGLYMYTIGLYDNYAEALLIKRDVERFGVTDAQILPYYDDRRLTEDQLVYYVNDFPDLQRLMNYGN